MLTAVAETSLSAYHALQMDGQIQPKEQEVLAAFGGKSDVLLTRQEIASKTGMAINSVCGRVKGLLEKGSLQVRSSRISPITRKSQELLGLPVKPQQ
ncbi:hypothetical protein M3795_16755 [Ralstonia pickettii]|jgi:predicted NAD/FAD-binding protein|uniref:HTH crp-type domain-containing protein n=1 Tax=Ralstonia pickettii OR214 TaxID=1264675 RepID=R0CT83_RALPI|nr:hypothetical protein [Ralstonia pickettii]ENZ79600.1 hypothetical protein OR214_00016 [Ralstonia pickettii OR214]MCM3582135.1 hypothetical protein [Ralstonia pickettii]